MPLFRPPVGAFWFWSVKMTIMMMTFVRPKQNAVGLSVFSKLIHLHLNVPIYEMYFNAASKKICILIQAYCWC